MNATRSDRSEHESSRTSPSMLLGAALRVVTCVLVAAGVAPRADAEPLFAAPFLSFDTGDGPQSVAIGDLNGDGKPDLAEEMIETACEKATAAFPEMSYEGIEDIEKEEDD